MLVAVSLSATERRLRPCLGRWVLLEADLAAFLGLTTGELLEYVRRAEPLPGELGFFVAAAAAPWDRPSRRLPYGFTEHGVIAVGFMIGSRTAVARCVQLTHAFGRVQERESGFETAPEGRAPIRTTAQNATHIRQPLFFERLGGTLAIGEA